MPKAILACVPGFLEELCGKTIVLSHQPLALRSPYQYASLRFAILVQKNNVRETRADMSKANRSHRM
jgi:hypothetical protein